jgi:Type II secretory pathway, ATPase PulE/Tfp pilus assembly pathway, ATPase PilB
VVDIGHLGISTLKSSRIHTPYKPVGCEKCRGTGFSGRTTISEVMAMSEGLRQVILTHAESRSIRDLAVREGMLTMLGHGVEKIAAGMTTLDEVLRATTDA